MTVFDQHLTDFTAAEVADAIDRAVEAVNRHGVTTSIRPPKTSARGAADRSAAAQEGIIHWTSSVNFEVYQNTGQVLVAWWTSAFGRRHARVVGRLAHHTRRYLVNDSMLGTRPPVWHVFPERVYRRRAGVANDIVAVCGCGVCGTERSLAWAGPCCGPCFDYAQEHGEPPRARPALLPTPGPCRAVAVSADGRRVAGATADRILVWDVDVGTEPIWESISSAEDRQGPYLALSPDGATMAVADAFFGVGGLAVISLASGVHRVSRNIPDSHVAAFHPGGRDVAYPAAGRLMLAELPNLAEEVEAVPRVTTTNPVAFSPDGSRVAVRVGEWAEIHNLDVSEPPVRFQLPAATRLGHQNPPTLQQRAFFAFSGDGSQVVVGAGQAMSVHDAASGDRRFWEGRLAAAVTGVAFDPGGRWVYVGTQDGTLLAYRADAFEPDRTVTLRWGLGPIHALAAGLDGETVYTAVDEGVKAWPVGRLLEGL